MSMADRWKGGSLSYSCYVTAALSAELVMRSVDSCLLITKMEIQ